LEEPCSMEAVMPGDPEKLLTAICVLAWREAWVKLGEKGKGWVC
jgi:hypothetical protein